MKKYKWWTSLEIRKLLELLDANTDYETIGKKLGRTKDSINGKVRSMRYRRGEKPLPRLHKPGELIERVKTLCIPGVPDSAVAGILGVTRTAIKEARKRANIPSGCRQHAKIASPERANISTRAKIIRLYSGVGKCNTEIANILGISKQWVYKVLLEFNLPTLGSPHCQNKTIKEPIIDRGITNSKDLEACILALSKILPKEDINDRVLSEILATPISTVQIYRSRLGIETTNKDWRKRIYDRNN